MSKENKDSILSKNPANDSSILWKLAWPAVTLNTLQVTNNLIDTKFVSSLPVSALTAVGASGTITFLMFCIAISVAIAASALVSRAYGAENVEEYQESAKQVFSFGFYVGIACLILLYVLKPFIIYHFLPNTDIEAGKYMDTYLSLTIFCLPAWMIIESVAGSMMGIGDSKSPMRISGFQVILHMILNVFMVPTNLGLIGLPEVPGLGWGVYGAGLSFVSSMWIAAIVYILWARRTPLGNMVSLQLPNIKWIERILNISGPASITWFLRVGMYMVLTKLLAELPGTEGSIAIAASRSGFALESICFMPAIGLSQAAGALVGQSLGMKDTDRASRIGWLAGHYSGLITGIAALILYIYVPQVAAWLVNEKPAVMNEAISFLRLMCFSEIFFGYALGLTGALSGAGDTKSPLWIAFISLWVIRIPLLYLFMFHLDMRAEGAWIVLTFTQGLMGLFTMIVFGRGKWKSIKV